ncbi:MAG: hypothetical protein K6E51_07425 [Treponema sp.]|nr:hypothetical protein [Treponema sp.]
MKLAIMNKKTILFSLLVVSCIGMTSCKSNKLILDEDMTVQEILQQGQNYSQSYKYKKALYCYNTVIDRYGDDPVTYVEAKFEIAHLYIKRKKYNLAKPILEEIKELYASSIPGTLPGAYNKLASLDLEKIPEKGKKQKISKNVDNQALSLDEEAPDRY